MTIINSLKKNSVFDTQGSLVNVEPKQVINNTVEMLC